MDGAGQKWKPKRELKGRRLEEKKLVGGQSHGQVSEYA